MDKEKEVKLYQQKIISESEIIDPITISKKRYLAFVAEIKRADDAEEALKAERTKREEAEKELAKWREDYPCCSGSPDCFNNKTQVFVDNILGKDGDPDKREYLSVVIESLETDAECYKHYLHEAKDKIVELEAKLTEAHNTIGTMCDELSTANAKIVELEGDLVAVRMNKEVYEKRCAEYIDRIVALEKDRNYWKKSAGDYSFINRELSTANKKAEQMVRAFETIKRLSSGKESVGHLAINESRINELAEQAIKEYRGEK